MKIVLKKIMFLLKINNFISYIPFNNRYKIKGKNNKIKNMGLLWKCKIEIIGNNNYIFINSFSRLKHCRIIIHGNNNYIDFDNNVFADDLGICIDFNYNSLIIGANCVINNGSHFSCMEGTTISIGEDCLFSSNVNIRTCDSHSILNKNGQRINKSENIIIGNHVWCGANVSFLKGAMVNEDSVIAMNSIVTREFEKKGVVLAGTPAKEVKSNISWDKKLI